MAEPHPSTRQAEHDPDTGASAAHWLTIREASELMGVDQTTLRRWSDSGEIPVYRTPGGHRRYDERDLRRLTGKPGPSTSVRSINQGALVDRSLHAYTRPVVRGAHERRWYKAFDRATLERHRQLGRSLVHLAMSYAITPPEDSDRESYLREARRIGAYYGSSGAQAGLAVTDTVDAFLYFRQPVVRSIMSLVEENDLPAREVAAMFAAVGTFLDDVLTAAVATHERHKEIDAVDG
jgi:excisionase family DNA binding protein